MNLAEMLSYADIQQLNRIAKHYACECSGNSKHELIQSILTAFNRRELFESYIRDLSVEDLRFVNSLVFDQKEAFSLEELIARISQSVAGKEAKEKLNPREIIAKFKYHGWLFNGFSQKTKYLFQVPNDIKIRFRETFASLYKTQLIEIEDPSVYREEHLLILDDLYFFLRHVYHNEIPLTSDGSMYKRSLQQVLEGMSVEEQPVGKVGWRFGYGRHFREYPNRFSLIYDYAYFNGLIEEREHVLSLSEKGEEVAARQRKEDIADFYRFWLRLYKGPIPNLQSLVNWIEILTRRWVSASSLGSILCKLIKPYYYDTEENILEHRVLQMLLHLGMIRIGESDLHGGAVQVTKLGSSLIRGTYVAEDDRIELPIDSA